LKIISVEAGCLSRILLLYPSRIPDPKTATKERVEKKSVVIPFIIATNFSKIVKWSPSSQNMGLGSGIRENLSRFPDQGSKRHRIPDPGCGSATLKIMTPAGTR
jgi:hypothetical protein